MTFVPQNSSKSRFKRNSAVWTSTTEHQWRHPAQPTFSTTRKITPTSQRLITYHRNNLPWSSSDPWQLPSEINLSIAPIFRTRSKSESIGGTDRCLRSTLRRVRGGSWRGARWRGTTRTVRPLMRGGQVLIGSARWSRRPCPECRKRGWRNRQAPSRGATATVVWRAVQPVAAISIHRKDGHDGWHGRPRAKSRPRVLPPAREKQAAVQRATGFTTVRAQAVAGLLRAHLWHLHEAVEVSTAAQVSETWKKKEEEE